MGWQALIIIHTLFAAFMTLQSRALARTKKTRHASMAINAVAFTVIFVSGILFVLMTEPISWSKVSTYWPYMVGAAICFSLSSVYLYRALAYMESANVSVIMTLSSIFTIGLAGIFLGERLSFLQFLGVTVLLPSIWYVLILSGREKRPLDMRHMARLKGFGHALNASILISSGIVLEKYILDNVSPSTYIGVGFTLQMVFAWSYVLLFRRKTIVVLKDINVLMQSIRLGAFRTIAGIAFLYALIRSDSASLMNVVANFRIIIVTILAALILNEKDHLHQKLIAAAGAFVAISIIFWN